MDPVIVTDLRMVYFESKLIFCSIFLATPIFPFNKFGLAYTYFSHPLISLLLFLIIQGITWCHSVIVEDCDQIYCPQAPL